MRSTLLLLAIIAGMAQAQDRGAVRLDKPYKWELKTVPYTPQGGLFKTETETWNAFGPQPLSTGYYGDVSGRVTCLAVDPTDSAIVYAGAADGGLWKSTDGGTTWTPLTDNLPRLSSGAVAIDPNNPSVIYYGTGELNMNIDGYPGAGVFKSTDGGANWNQLTMPAGGGMYYTSSIAVAPSNSNIVYMSGYYDVYKSTDAGNSWTELHLTDGAADAIVVDPKNANVVYASYGSGFSADSSNYGIYKSTDGGSTWAWLKNGLPPASQVTRASLAIAPSNDQILYAAINGNRPNNASLDTNRVFKSTDGGASWSVVSPVKNGSDFGGDQGWYNNVIAVDPTHPDTVYVGGIDFWRSADGGQTWTNLTNGYGTYDAKNMHPDQHAIAFAAGNGQTFYIGNDGGVWKTTDGSVNFTNCNADLQTIQFYDIAVSPGNSSLTIGGAQDNGTESNTAPSDTWNEIYGGDGGYVLIDPSNPQNIYTEYVNGALQESTDGGKKFYQITNGIASKPQGYWLQPYVMDPANDKVLYTGTDKIYKTTDGGDTWTAITGVMKTSSDLFTTMSISPIDGNVIYAGMSGYRGADNPDSAFLFVTTDGGSNWTNVTGNLPRGTDFARVTADPSHRGTAYLAVLLGNSNVFRTTDFGSTWEPLDSTGNGFGGVPTKIITVDSTNGYIYAGTYAGVYRSINNGASWQKYGIGLPNSVVDGMAMQYSSDMLRVGTHGRGAWQVNPVTGIATAAGPPTSFALDQNYPNPFNPTTTIKYSLPKASNVQISVYNILGEKVDNLVDGFRQPGKHSIVFNASKFASGVYFYTLRAGNISMTKKMVLVK